MKTSDFKRFSFPQDVRNGNKNIFLVRKALNYSFWIFENYKKSQPLYIEKAIKNVFELIKVARNTEIEVNCLFIYWLLHEILFSASHVDSERIHGGMTNINIIGSYFDIEAPKSALDVDTFTLDTSEHLLEHSGV